MIAVRSRPLVILVVDDEALPCTLAVDHFEEAGYEVLEAWDGAQAAAMMRVRPDTRAVITDAQMPDKLDGFALSRPVRDICPNCAIIVASGRVKPAPSDLAEKARYMPKPYQGAQVVRIVDEMLAE